MKPRIKRPRLICSASQIRIRRTCAIAAGRSWARSGKAELLDASKSLTNLARRFLCPAGLADRPKEVLAPSREEAAKGLTGWRYSETKADDANTANTVSDACRLDRLNFG